MRNLLLAAVFFLGSASATAQTYEAIKPSTYEQNQLAQSFCTTYKNLALRPSAEAICQGKILQALAELVNQTLKLPRKLTIVGRECGTSNAFYTPSNTQITMCYELVKEISDRVQREIRSDQSTQSQIAMGAMVFIFLHELGHAAIDIYNLPVLGRQEDAADQIGTYFLLALTEQRPEIAGYWPLGAHWYFRKSDLFYSRKHYADSHSLNPQRQFNISCWVFGSNPKKYLNFARNSGLTNERAQNCPREYRDMNSAANQMLSKHFNDPYKKLQQQTTGTQPQKEFPEKGQDAQTGRVPSATSANTTKTCAPDKHSKIPLITGLVYHKARQMLLSEGWQPLQTKSLNLGMKDPDISTGNGTIFWSKGYMELESCSGTGTAPCAFLFKDIYGNRARIVTTGEEVYSQQTFAMVSNYGFTCEP